MLEVDWHKRMTLRDVRYAILHQLATRRWSRIPPTQPISSGVPQEIVDAHAALHSHWSKDSRSEISSPLAEEVLRTPVDKALFLQQKTWALDTPASHLYFFRLGTQRLPSGSLQYSSTSLRCMQDLGDEPLCQLSCPGHVSMRMDVFSSSPNCADQFSCYLERGSMAMRREVAWWRADV